MKLRPRFGHQQLLFLLGGAASILTASTGFSDVIISTKDQRQEVKILGVSGSNLQVQIGAGTIGYPLASIKEVQMAQPPEFARAQQAFAAKDYAAALRLVQPIVDKFKGLPTDWARSAVGMVGDLHLALGDVAKAEAAYKDYQRVYPGAGSLHTEVGMARIAVSKKEFAGAKQKLQPLAEAALKEKTVPRANAVAYSQTFYALGQIKEAEGDHQGALEDYLRTVTLFYHDPAAVSAAQERADAIRKEHQVHVP